MGPDADMQEHPFKKVIPVIPVPEDGRGGGGEIFLSESLSGKRSHRVPMQKEKEMLTTAKFNHVLIIILFLIHC